MCTGLGTQLRTSQEALHVLRKILLLPLKHCSSRNTHFFTPERGDLVSLKTTDTRTKSWEAGIRQEIRALPKARINVGGMPGNKFMDIRVQPGGLQEAQRLIAYGRRYEIFP